MEISDADVRAVEALASIQLGDAEREHLRADLQRILGSMQALAAIDVEGVPPTSHVLDAHNVWREDRVEPSLPPETMLANAPDAVADHYRVPRFLGEGETES
jgi:aspartyl-tRNA(Asn)/glutamyl-tRNA(Gln) amidotransferase subunit C